MVIFNVESANATCQITKHIYRAVDDKGFELRFNNPPANSALHFATVTLWHPKRGNIGTLIVGNSQGFGTIYFQPQNNLEDSTNISAYFFDSKFKSAEDYNSAQFLFVSGLGSWDWYDNQMTGGRDVFLGNPIWKFDRCQ